MTIVILGLGPGDRRMLTIEAYEKLTHAQTVYLRTARHPVVDQLTDHTSFVDFDHLYDEAERFEDVYRQIAEKIIRVELVDKDPKTETIFAVPGHPLVGETTTKLILELAEEEAIPVKIIPGLSFIEPMLTLLRIDGLDGIQLVDALEAVNYYHPPVNCDRPAIVAQVYNKQIANDVKLSLMSLYPDEHEVVLIHGAGSSEVRVEPLPLYKIDRSSDLSPLTSLFIPELVEPGSLTTFAETVAILRGPNGCPWDQEQTPESLRSTLLEEAAEVLTAIDDKDSDSLAEELGDLLYHIIMQVQMASEEGLFQLSDVIGGIDAKLKRRHPHVWGDGEASNSEEVIKTWEEIKAHEKRRGDSVLDNIPYALPSLARAQTIQSRVKRVGFDWPTIDGVTDKIQEEIIEVDTSVDNQERERELGDLFFALVNWIRWQGFDAESSLRAANRRFEARFRQLERMAAAEGSDLKKLNIDELELLWLEAKKELNSLRSDQDAE